MKIKFFGLAAAAVLLAGCMASKADKYYLLDTVSAGERLPISLYRIDLPEYLEQSNLVRYIGDSRMEFIQGHRWMGSFKGMLEDALEDGLKPSGGRPVALRIRKLAASDDGKFYAEIDCLQGEKVSRISFTLPCSSSDPDSIVTAYRAAVPEVLKRLAEL